MEAGALKVTRAVSGEQHRDARIPVVIERVFQHPQLQHAVGHLLLTTFRAAAVEQPDLHAGAFETIPELAHLWRDRADGDGMLDFSPRVRKAQHRVEIDLHQVAGARAALAFLGEALRFVEDV